MFGLFVFPTADVGLVENMSTILEPKVALLLQKIFSKVVFEILGKHFKAAANFSKYLPSAETL